MACWSRARRWSSSPPGRTRPRVTLTFSGAASNIAGPPGPSYGDLRTCAADYGTVAPGATTDCYNATPSHDCYVVTVAGARPVPHWDATFDENLSLAHLKSWTLHVGESFTDVPRHSSSTGSSKHLPQRHHGRVRPGHLLPGQLGDAGANGGLPAEVRAWPDLQPASLHAGDFADVRARASSPTGSSSSTPKASPAAAATATTARTMR